MSTTRSTLETVSSHVAESLGVRDRPPRVSLSPVPAPKDIGRRPAKGFGTADIDQLTPDPDQPRTDFDPDSLTLLAESIRSRGQLHPIHVRWSDEMRKWVIITGDRRWRAARQAGLTTVDCFFHEEALTRSQILELQLVENLLREDLKPIEEAHAFRDLLDLNGWNGKQVAESLRIPASKVTRSLALLRLPNDIQEQVDAGEVPARTAYEISKITNDNTRRRMAREAAAGQLTNADAANVARVKRRQQRQTSSSVKQVFFAENGWRVSVSSRKPGSYHEIEQALVQALEEVRLRLANNIRL